LRSLIEIDTRPFLPCIDASTLVVHRRGDMMSPLAGARFLSEALPHAELCELEGNDHLPFVAGSDSIAAHVNEFLMNAVPLRPQRRLRTVVGLRWSSRLPMVATTTQLEREARRSNGELHPLPEEHAGSAAFIFASVNDAVRFAAAVVDDATLPGARAAVATGAVPLLGASALGQLTLQHAHGLAEGVVAVKALPWLLTFGTAPHERQPFERWPDEPVA
jgi:hypothetical protein